MCVLPSRAREGLGRRGQLSVHRSFCAGQAERSLPRRLRVPDAGRAPETPELVDVEFFLLQFCDE